MYLFSYHRAASTHNIAISDPIPLLRTDIRRSRYKKFKDNDEKKYYLPATHKYQIDIDKESYQVFYDETLTKTRAYDLAIESSSFEEGDLFSKCLGESSESFTYEKGSKSPFTGITVEYSKKGFIRMRTSYKNGKMNGLREFYRTGKLVSKKCYENDYEVSMLYCE